ncbi:MAG: hypothetical protein PUC44_03480 [Eubacteriales bacterium]|nr:hypothetical protein [Eubacteriales bacterium]
MKTLTAIIGADAGCGSTMCAETAAELIGKNASVLLISASGKFGDDYIQNKEGCSLDDLKAALLSGSLEEKEFLRSLVREKGIMILPSVRDPSDADRYTGEAMNCLLQAADRYEYVILDLGERMDSPFLLRGAEAADRRYFVLTQQAKTLRRFRERKEKILDPLSINGRIVINKYRRSSILPSAKEIESEFGMPVCGTIPWLDSGWQAEAERSILFRDGRALRTMENIAHEITGKMKVRKTWKKNWMFRKV